MEKLPQMLLVEVLLLLSLYSSKAGAVRKTGACLAFNENAPCRPIDFKCLRSEQCIESKKYCDGVYDCLDQTDEKHCSDYSSLSLNPLLRCRKYDRYRFPDRKITHIPVAWLCNGRSDCPEGEDEENCENKYSPTVYVHLAREKAIQWLKNKTRKSSATAKWGQLVHKSAVALYLADSNFTNTSYPDMKEIAYEVSIQLLSELARKKLGDVSDSELAHFVNAFLVTCVNPRKFHGINLVEELRKRVDAENGTNPYLLLTLCKAGETITEADREKIIHSFRSIPRLSWTGSKAMAIMALSCASEQYKDAMDMTELTMALKQRQHENGTVQNLQTTALTMQALYSAEYEEDTVNFNEAKAIVQILSHQQEDGSFGDFMKTYYVLPVLNCRSLVNISSSHCKKEYKNEKSGMQDLVNRVGPKVRVHYSLWINEERDKKKTLTLKVPAMTSAYGVMEMAADIDSKYKFEYVTEVGKPYITAVSGVLDDAENGKLWFPYVLENDKPVPIETSPADYILKDNEHFVMWYKKLSWTG